MVNDDGTASSDLLFIPRIPVSKNYVCLNKWDHESRVYWSQKEPPQKSISSSSSSSSYRIVPPEYWDIHEKIKSAFYIVNLSPFNKGLILQFWSLVKNTNQGNPFLTTSNQPFLIDHPLLFLYRKLCCTNTLHTGPLNALMNNFPEVIMDLTVYKGVPFYDKAIACGLTCCIMLPVFYLSSQAETRYCLGVVQCCMMKPTRLDFVFNQLKLSLAKVGLGTYSVQNYPYENLDGISLARDELTKALGFVCESHHLPLAQVWIRNHKHSITWVQPSSTSVINVGGLLVLKLCGYHLADDDASRVSSVIKSYSDTCDVLPLKLGEGLVGKAHRTHLPHLCRNMSKLPMTGILTSLSRATKCSCFVICLRSIHTGDDVDYVFEFFWHKSRDFLTLLETLLLTLKTRLPNFKVASGAQLGDELCVTDVDTSTSFNLLSVKKISLLPKAMETQAPHKGGQGPVSRKRKLSELSWSDSESESQTDYESDLYSEEGEEDHDVIMFAVYEEKASRFITRTSYPLAYARKIIEERFNLDHGTYSMEYEFEEERATLGSDQDLDSCIKLWTSSLKRRGRKGHIVLLLSTLE